MSRESGLQIALVRHGRPAVDFSQGSPDQVDWIEAYDLAGIDPRLPPPDAVKAIGRSAAYAVSSDLRRAIESLQAIGRDEAGPAESLYREVELRGLPAIPFRIDPELRARIGRFGWRFGWSHPTESAPDLYRRARAAAKQLSTLASTHGSVLLVGHGWFNTLIAWRLRTAGWSGPALPTGSYWSSAVYRKAAR